MVPNRVRGVCSAGQRGSGGPLPSAAIDFGVSIEVDLDDLRLNNEGLSRSHFRLCRIRYPRTGRGSEDDFGYLLYVKLSLSGNEGEFIRRYSLEEPCFPHHPTVHQFFSEAQFEAYRRLGEHVRNKLFLRVMIRCPAEAFAEAGQLDRDVLIEGVLRILPWLNQVCSP